MPPTPAMAGRGATSASAVAPMRLQSVFFGALNAVYAREGEGLNRDNYNAPVGFIEE